MSNFRRNPIFSISSRSYTNLLQMKYLSSFLLSFMLLAVTTGANAQTVMEEQATTIFDSFQGAGKGDVVVHQAPAIKALIGARMHGENVEKTGDEAFLKIQGYRAQVFSGNNQRKSKDEAFQKEKEIKELFPDVPTYVTYTAPFWRVRVGDFQSHEEAYHMMRQLMNAFPSYRKEMYIVREEVKIPLN